MPECRVFKGATRPAMIAGVPLVPMVALCLGTIQPLAICLIVQFYAAALLLAGLFVGAFIWLRMISKHDGFRTKQELLRMRTRRHKGNLQIWGGVSYGPLRLKKHIQS